MALRRLAGPAPHPRDVPNVAEVAEVRRAPAGHLNQHYVQTWRVKSISRPSTWFSGARPVTTPMRKLVGVGPSRLATNFPLTPNSAVSPSTIRSSVFVAPGAASNVDTHPARVPLKYQKPSEST